MEFSHIPVLLQPCLDGLAIDPAGIYLDGTAGGAGHSMQIAKRLTTGQLIALDQDPDAVATATERLKGLPARVVQANFRDAARVLAELSIPAVNGGSVGPGRFQPPAGRGVPRVFLPCGRTVGHAYEPAGPHRRRPGQFPGP